MDKTAELEAVLCVAARRHFWAFCCFMDWDFFAIRRRFLKDVALILNEVIDAYIDGNALKVAISMPPRSGKSYVVSMFAAYVLGRLPLSSVMRNACTSSLYEKFSYDTRALVKSDRFRQIFPEVKLSDDKKNLSGWSLAGAHQVSYFGGGVGSSIIGFGANIAITDDLYTGMKDAMSETVQASTKMWKQSEHNSRMEKNCPEIFVGTRWTMDDVIGEAITSGLHRSITIPALINDHSFCEDVKTTDEYLAIREGLRVGERDGLIWLAEYMQSPTDYRNTLLPIDRLRFEDLSLIPLEAYNYLFAVADPADTGGDKYACPFIGVRVDKTERNGHETYDIRAYVLGALCNEEGIVANTLQILEKRRSFRSQHVYIEKNGIGLASFIELSKYLKPETLIDFTSSEDKEVRITSSYEFIEAHFVFDKSFERDRQYSQFMTDLTGFVKGGTNRHKKDAIDTLSTAAQIIQIKYAQYLF
jgi:hypothetical protein